MTTFRLRQSAWLSSALILLGCTARLSAQDLKPDAPNADEPASSAPAEEAKARAETKSQAATRDQNSGKKVVKTLSQWRRQLSGPQFMVTRMKVTEPPFSGRYATGHFRGTFICVCCGAELFSSAHKFESGTGWPSFYRPIRAGVLSSAPDYSELPPRIEVLCSRCNAHLGHVFPDGPPPTGQRFCINSLALKLVPRRASSTNRTSASKSKKPDASQKPKTEPETETPK